MGARGSGGVGRRPVIETDDYRADLRGRSVDARAVIRMAFGAITEGVERNWEPVADDVGPELRTLAERTHPF